MQQELREKEILKIAGGFEIDTPLVTARLFGNGHIHKTYRLSGNDSGKPEYILQRINQTVFPDIPNLQGNIVKVTDHIAVKLKSIPGSNLSRECLTVIPARNGESFIVDEKGEYWRMFLFIGETSSYDAPATVKMAGEGGRAVGRFLSLVADLPGESLHETLPQFHNVARRLDLFRESVENNRSVRAGKVEREIDEILSRADEMSYFQKLSDEGVFPLRTTHNDTKFNNILFDKDDKALVLIDLDTVMPGHIHYDFGDAIRTAANHSAEDEPDISKVKFDIQLYRSWAKSFLAETANTLESAEKEWLPFAPRLLTYIMAVRFLTDFIDGDRYFNTKHPGHNLQRTAAQLQLLKLMEKSRSEMESILH